MATIAERLRETYDAWNKPPSEALPDGAGVLLEAADEIEGLRKLLAKEKKLADQWKEQAKSLLADLNEKSG